MKTIITFLTLACLITFKTFSQGTAINTNGTAPDPSAMLDIKSNDKGLLVPRMTTGARDSIVTPAEGLLIFNTTSKCFNFYKSGSWFEWCGNCIAPSAAVAGSNSPICSGSTLNLTATYIPNVTYTWTGPNGFTSTQQNPVILNTTTTNSGLYQVRTNNQNCSSNYSGTTAIINPVPASAFSFTPTSPGLNMNVTFTPSETGATYSWTFQNGNPATSNAQNPVVSWVSAGTYDITLTVVKNGCTSTITTQQITVTVCSPNTVTFSYTGSIVTYIVPTNACGTVTVDVMGAQGGNAGVYTGGLGARIKGDFTNLAGQTIKILVGQQGAAAINNSDQSGGCGGGGSFVTLQNNSPLMIAGGGGGAENYTGASMCNGGPGQITTSGQTGGGSGGAGGSGGGGGTTWPWTGWHSGTGGGGLTGNGINNSNGDISYGTVNTPGIAFINGGAGGTGGSLGRNGGFGGGGATGFTGGGGGGYSGGGSGNYQSSPTYGGGGGGSYNGGTNQTNTPGYQSGNGQVIISW
ncbi:MAG: PKD domain-containing protein [Bacteroidota bacterium]